MKFFLDSVNIKDILYFKELGLVDGITTNPSIIAASERSIYQVATDLCNIIDTSVSIEVIAADTAGMLLEAEKLYSIGSQVTVTLPATYDGFRTCKALSLQGKSVNITLCFSPLQALTAAKCGAEYVSLVIGRLDDCGLFGLDMIADVCTIYENYPHITTKIIAASIRSPIQVIELAKMGVDIVTVAPKILHYMVTEHPMTTHGLNLFFSDWQNAQQSI